jgi:hypothetical protein
MTLADAQLFAAALAAGAMLGGTVAYLGTRTPAAGRPTACRCDARALYGTLERRLGTIDETIARQGREHRRLIADLLQVQTDERLAGLWHEHERTDRLPR